MSPADGAPPPEDNEGALPPPSTYAGRRRQEPPDPETQDPLDQDIEAALPPAPEPPVAQEPPPPADPPPAAEAPPKPATPEAGKTIEADTLAIADREEAEEAALAGLRARTAAHVTQTDRRVAAATAPAAAAAAAGASPPQAPPKPPQPPAPPKQPPPASGTPPRATPPPPPPTSGVGEAPKRRIWPRFLAASVVIVVAIATATAVSGLVFASNIAAGLEGLPSVENLLQVSDPEGPQTFLILGSDKRPGEGDHGRSDTTILMRLTSTQINLLSIPRDLKVNIPGHGVNKLNAAYTYGGPRLTTRVVKELTGLPINHVVNIDFTGFADAVDSIGCVYYDVDHHYFHSNAGLAAIDQYAAINIHAGYQRMCGYNALQFVRYRHDDNDLVRAARQQAFLREARAQVPPSKLLSDYQDLTNIFTKYTTSDIHSTETVIGLMKLLLSARSAQVKQIHFPAILGAPTDTYVTAHTSAIHGAVRELLGEPVSSGSGSGGGGGGGTKAGGTSKGSSSHGGSSGGATKAPGPASDNQGNGNQGGSNIIPPTIQEPLINATAQGQQYAAKLSDKRWRREGKIPMLYPTKLVPGSYLTPDSDEYRIDGPGNDIYNGYTFVGEIPAGTNGYGYTAYYDFTGTNWRDAPILDNPTETKVIGGKSYMLFWDSGRLRLVGWKTSKGSYWVDNDLLETLTPGQMTAMAEAMRNSKG